MNLLLRALTELKAGEDRPYLVDTDHKAAEVYYAEIELGGRGATRLDDLAGLLEESHRDRPRYSPATELYPWVDLQPDRKVRSVYTLDEYDPAELIEGAARIHDEREALRATAASEAA